LIPAEFGETEMSKSLHQVVVSKAREIVADPDRWIQGELARRRDDSSAEPTDPLAYRFCAVGAIQHAAYQTAPRHRNLGSDALTAVEQFMHAHYPEVEDNLEDLNDAQRQAVVLKVFDDFLSCAA
jgi:hypothetical protein